MAQKLNAPEKFEVRPDNKSVLCSWNAVKGARGYILRFYRSDNAEKCIKIKYSRQTKKLISGLENGCGYLVRVCAFYVVNGKEIAGEYTEKIPFTPAPSQLCVQQTICLKTGECDVISWESPEKDAFVTFKSDNPLIASVSQEGTVTAHSKGTAVITTSASDGQSLKTNVFVDRAVEFGSNKAVLLFGGDIMCTPSQQRAAKPYYDFHYGFASIGRTLKTADYAVGFYSSGADDSAAYESELAYLSDGTSNTNAPSTMISAAAAAGFSALITAGITNPEKRSVTEKEIGRCGMTSISDNTAAVNIKGFNTAIVSYNALTTDKETLSETIKTARTNGAEFVIVCTYFSAPNSICVKRSQVEQAQCAADSGADLIIGSGTHTVQRFSYIKSANRKIVPCAYSLGNFLSGMRILDENRDGALMRLELTRNERGIIPHISFIPLFQADGTLSGICSENLRPFTQKGRLSLERVKNNLGRQAAYWGYRPRVLLSGSAVLAKIFSQGNVNADKTPMMLSPMSLCSAAEFECDENENPKLALDIRKNLPEYIRKTQPDFIAVDFYIPAAYSCFKARGDIGAEPSFLTNTPQLRNSEFFSKHKSDLVRIRPPFGETIWKPMIKRYAQQLISAFPNKKIILFRCTIPSCRAVETELRTALSHEKINTLIRKMEDYFISIASPCIIDLSKHYFSTGKELTSFESEYYTDAYNAATQIMSGVGRSYISTPSAKLWFSRVMKYYDSMTARSYQSRLLDMDNAADKLVAYTSAEFAARHSSRIIQLKQVGKSELCAVADFFSGDSGAEELIHTAQVIDELLKGRICHNYDFFQSVFREKFGILRVMVRLLSEETGLSVNEKNAELVFLLRGKSQLKRYAAIIKQNSVDIWGSSISRESVNQSYGFISSYICKQPPILAFEPDADFDIPENDELFCGSSWRRKNFCNALLHNGLELIEESRAEWIVLDFYDVISQMADYKGTLFATDDFLKRTEFYKSLSPEPSECYIFEKIGMKFCAEAIRCFAERILECYGDRIILIKAEPKSSYITLDNRLSLLEADEMFDIKRRFISLCEECFATVTGCYVIDISKHFYASDAFPLGGASIVHYEDEFYRKAGEYISEILQGTQRRIFSIADDNYLMLRNLRLQRE